MRFPWIQCDFKQCEEMQFPPERKPVLVLVTDICRGEGPFRRTPSGGWAVATERILCCGVFSCCQLFIITYSTEREYLVQSKLEIKREKSRKIRKSPPLGLNIGQRYFNVATPRHGTPHLPHMKFNPFSLLTKHLLCQVGLTHFPATCCGPAVTLRLPPSHPPGGDDRLLLRATTGAPGWGHRSAVGPCQTWSHPGLLLTGPGATCVCSVLFESHSELMTDPRYVPCDWCTGSQDILPLSM